MKILGVNLENLNFLNYPAKFKYVIFPDESFGFTDERDKIFFTNEYLTTINRIRDYAVKNYSQISTQKIYYFYGQKQIGEERIAQYLQSKGYAVIRPETLSIEDQLNVLVNCKEFASTLGSISHNIIFMKDDANVTLIPRFGLNAYQMALDQLYDINVYYVDSSLSLFRQQNNFAPLGPLCYIISENLRKHFGDEVTEKYTEEDIATFLAYGRIAKNQGMIENPNELAYLKDILPEFISQLKTREDLMKKFGVGLK